MADDPRTSDSPRQAGSGDRREDPGRAGGDETPTPLSEIGAALRRLRMQRGLRQYEAAEAAGVTKAMLSAYETGKRRPSLKTLDSLLSAMGAHLGDLHRALMAERRQTTYLAGDRSVPRPHVISEASASAYGAYDGYATGRGGRGGVADVYDLLGIHGSLPAEEERALSEMLQGFLKLLRFLHHQGGEGVSRGPFDGG